MHGPFRVLGVGLACYIVVALLRGQVYARSGPWGREFARATDAWGYWSAVLCYSLLSAALMFVF